MQVVASLLCRQTLQPGDPEGVPYAIETVEKLILGMQNAVGSRQSAVGSGQDEESTVHNLQSLIPNSQIANRKSPIPIFGICLGHQILCLALGGKTYKLKFGHRGGNQPVKDLSTGKIDITSQNHGFCVDVNSINMEEIEITHINPNDQTIEGMKHKTLPIFSVQYHPEASPGPRDASYLFDRFVGMMIRNNQ